MDHPQLATFDELLRTTLNTIINANLSDLHWIWASLPVSDGGLGVRRVSTLALPAFLSSYASTSSTQLAILASCQPTADPLQALYFTKWVNNFGPAPTSPSDGKQSAWDAPGIAAERSLIQTSLSTHRDKAVFLAASAPHSGAWLSALPLASCGLHLDDEAVRVGAALRLGLPLCGAHLCTCGEQVDIWGSHAAVCKNAPASTIRHFAINDIIARSITAAGAPVSKEPTGLAKAVAKRPDGVTQIPWRGGKALAWDATISCTLAASYIVASAAQAGSAAELAAANKTNKYSFLQPDYIFQPVAFESLGTCSSSTADFIAEIGSKISAKSGDPRETYYLWQRLAVCIQRFNAILLHQSFSEVFEEPDG